MRDFLVSARKYRPVRFDEVIGQEHVTETLKNALKSNKLAHAFLFCGPRGVGKTTCARILAKVINCEKPDESNEPCNECSSCRAFLQNKSVNIAELDAASHNSVDNIRTLVDQVRYMPQQGSYKVYIIDEVHMLSPSAFNAFLKTLEEPPDYAIFILATTEKHKILPTILSRCQIYDFSRISVADMTLHLKNICKTENIDAEEQALHIIAEKADGALRDALSLFDRLVSAGNNNLRYQDVIRQLHILDYDYFFRAFDSIQEEDIPAMLVLTDEIMRLGFEPDHFLQGITEHLRHLLMCRFEDTVGILDVTDSVKQRYMLQAAQSTDNLILSLLNIASRCDADFRLARNKRLHLETALIKMCHVNRLLTGTPLSSGTSNPGVVMNMPTPRVQEPTEYQTGHAGKESPVKTGSKAKTDDRAQQRDIQNKNPGTSAEITSPQSTDSDSAVTVPQPAISATEVARTEATAMKNSDLEMETLPSFQALKVKAKQESEEARKKKSNEVPVQEKLQQALRDYMEKHANNSLKGILAGAVWKPDEDAAWLHVSSQMAQAAILDTADFTPVINELCGGELFEIRIKVDKTLKASEPERPKPGHLLSETEKYRQLREINPEIEHLRDLFDLTTQ